MTPNTSSRYFHRMRTKADIEVGAYLARLRTSKGLTQTTTAALLKEATDLNWTQVMVSNLERGRTQCTITQYIQLCDLYGAYDSDVHVPGHTAWQPCVELPTYMPPKGAGK